MKLSTLGGAALAAVGAVAVRDLTQKHHAILRNFPVVGHARYLLEKAGPELRQYIVADNNEGRPFSRDQRRWVYASSKKQNNYYGFGTDQDVEHRQGRTYIKHRAFALEPPTGIDDPAAPLASAKVLGEARGRREAFRPKSAINISAMSYGSISAPAIAAMGKGAAAAGVLHNTGEGGVSPHHRQGQDLVMQIGTAYFGCRTPDGRFDLAQLKELVEKDPIRAIEIKLSQGAKPGLGGLLPGSKVTEEIAAVRGIPAGEDCQSPSRHTAFGDVDSMLDFVEMIADDVDSMLDFVEMIADETGLPVGIKSAVGESAFWEDLADQMAGGQRGVDFITVDGGEGGTGAAPLVFSDSIALPFRMAFSRVRRVFGERGLLDDITLIGSGKLGLPETAVVGFALGADLLNVGREAMMSVGCIQAQKCHTGDCPTGVATQNPWLMRGLDVENKSERCATYLIALRRELLQVCDAIGVSHPSQITMDDVEIANGSYQSSTLAELYG